MRRLVAFILGGVVLAAAAAAIATRDIAPATPNAPGTFSFAVLGDGPYSRLEPFQYQLVLQELTAHPLSLVLHVGDILWWPCSDERYRQTLAEFNALPHPVIYTPGDNEWTDCWEEITGRFDPLERLTALRQIFFAKPGESLGTRPAAVITQGGRDPFPEFVENVRWRHEGIVFATVNLPGSWNAGEPFPGRSAVHDTAARRRTEAAAAWIREAFSDARSSGAGAVVIGFHANPGFDADVRNEYRQAYEPFLTALEEETERFAGPVLVAHGDTHEFRVDKPLVRRTTGRGLDNVTRLEVPGSPDIGWVRVTVTPGARPRFAFESRLVPFWKMVVHCLSPKVTCASTNARR